MCERENIQAEYLKRSGEIGPDLQAEPLNLFQHFATVNQSVWCEKQHNTRNRLKPHNKTHNKTAATRASDFTGRGVFLKDYQS